MNSPVSIRLIEPDLPPISLILPYLDEAYQNNYFSNFGPLSIRLEAALLERYGIENTQEQVVLTSNATAGLIACLLHIQIRKVRGSKCRVILPAYSFLATNAMTLFNECDYIYLDVDPDSLTYTTDAIEKTLVGDGSDVVLIVIPFGFNIDVSHLIELSLESHAKVIVDNASGLGRYRAVNKPHPDVYEVYSMHATKPFGIGEGGCIFCTQDSMDSIKQIINFGYKKPDPTNQLSKGFNGKMSELHAAVGLAQLMRIDQILAYRAQCATSWFKLLQPFDQIRRYDFQSTWPFFPVRFDSAVQASLFAESMREAGIEVRNYYYPVPALLYHDHKRCRENYPVSLALSETVVALPIRQPQHASLDYIQKTTVEILSS